MVRGVLVSAVLLLSLIHPNAGRADADENRLLNTKIILAGRSNSAYDAVQEIEKQSSAMFSYKSDLFDELNSGETIPSGTYSVGELLNMFAVNGIGYEVKEDNVILKSQDIKAGVRVSDDAGDRNLADLRLQTKGAIALRASLISVENLMHSANFSAAERFAGLLLSGSRSGNSVKGYNSPLYLYSPEFGMQAPQRASRKLVYHPKSLYRTLELKNVSLIAGNNALLCDETYVGMSHERYASSGGSEQIADFPAADSSGAGVRTVSYSGGVLQDRYTYKKISSTPLAAVWHINPRKTFSYLVGAGGVVVRTIEQEYRAGYFPLSYGAKGRNAVAYSSSYTFSYGLQLGIKCSLPRLWSVGFHYFLASGVERKGLSPSGSSPVMVGSRAYFSLIKHF